MLCLTTLGNENWFSMCFDYRQENYAIIKCTKKNRKKMQRASITFFYKMIIQRQSVTARDSQRQSETVRDSQRQSDRYIDSLIDR